MKKKDQIHFSQVLAINQGNQDISFSSNIVLYQIKIIKISYSVQNLFEANALSSHALPCLLKSGTLKMGVLQSNTTKTSNGYRI
jgi:hypothetical protein